MAQHFSKLPPQNAELERAILGVILLEKDAILKAAPILKEGHFYEIQHQLIYKTIYDLFAQGKHTDYITVAIELNKAGNIDVIGGAKYLQEITNRVNNSTTLESNIRYLQEIAIRREIINLSAKVQELAYSDQSDGFEVLSMIQSRLNQLTKGLDNGRTKHISTIMKDCFEHFANSMNKDGVTGVKTGFSSIDEITGGFQPQDLIIMAARPGMGKTALVVSMARNMAVMFNQPVALFSLEMSDRQLVNRIIAGETHLSANQLNRGAIQDHEFQRIMNMTAPLNGCPLYIDDTAGLSVVTFRTKAFRLVAECGVKCIIVDYLQLMKGEGKGNREQEISEISRTLKMVAKELNIPIIALSQLSRSVESRGGDKRPMLSDLRESGAIEQDADIVTFIYRPEYYNITQDESGNSLAGMAEVIFSKHRSGSLGTVVLKFESRFAKFSDFNDPEIIEDKPDALKGYVSTDFYEVEAREIKKAPF
jgi:replicative DNA helicase